jgi:hypothetical protein
LAAKRRFFVFSKAATPMARDVHVLPGSGVNRSTTTDAASWQQMGREEVDAESSKSMSSRAKEIAREPHPCGRVKPAWWCVLGTHAGRRPAVRPADRPVPVHRVVGVSDSHRHHKPSRFPLPIESLAMISSLSSSHSRPVRLMSSLIVSCLMAAVAVVVVVAG